ncbi:MAG: DUF6569 family protein [Thermoguttaceae bacterium]|jgi:hypothetical protein
MSAKRARSTLAQRETRKTTLAKTVQGSPGAVTQPNGLFAELCLGKPLHHRNLTVFPLSWANPHEAPYILLGTAIEAGQAVVEEVNEAGSVPNLAVTNKADRPLLIPEGETYGSSE